VFREPREILVSKERRELQAFRELEDLRGIQASKEK